MEWLDRLTTLVGRPQFLQGALWSSLGLVTIVLVAMLGRRWKRLTPLHKCTAFSVWAHLVLIVYATSVQIVAERTTHGPPGHGDGRIAVRLTIDPQAKADDDAAPATSATPLTSSKEFDPTIPRPKSFVTPRSAKQRVEKKSDAGAKPQARGDTGSTTPSVPAPMAAAVPRVRVTSNGASSPTARPAFDDLLTKSPPPLAPADLPLQDLARAAPIAKLAPPVPSAAAPVETAAKPIAIAAPPTVPVAPAAPTPAAEAFELPSIYQQRVAGDRERIASAHGGSPQTEAAVKRALAWLALNQEVDGRWDADRFGAGRETQTLGQHRGGAGANADTGITGLAMLALLGSGHTHLRGDYMNTVGRGLDFLAAAQHPDGNLGGKAEPYAFMYCHGMATLALSEALAMSGDARLKPIVERAIGYTLRAQNRTTGGWRYRPGDMGDMSQLGWQLMSLKSAELAGIEFPTMTRQGIEQFVASVSSGTSGGLASYRTGERTSRPMTAEALLCRQFLGTARANPALNEAGDYLLGELPGSGQANFYYWYYGTLAMYQLQGEHWRRWNEALTDRLLATQTTTGESAGSWEPNDVWGGYGGRVYSTALATLCLEVYYRYLPLYVEAAANGDATRRK
jgi:hypothetical protein